MTLLRRTHDADAFNALVNDATIYPWVRGPIVGVIDLAPLMGNPANVFLIGDHGGFAFLPIQTGIYDVHAQALASGRGAWALQAAHEAAWFAFTQTDAIEIVARVPRGNRRVKALAARMGMRRQFTIENGWVLDGRVVSADIYALTMQDWLAHDDFLGERAERLKAKIAHSPIAAGVDISDATARHIAAVLDMILANQWVKARVFHDRYAALALTPKLSILSQSPLAVEICGIVFILRGAGEYFVASVNSSYPHMKAAAE